MSRTPDCVVIGGAMVDEVHAVSNLPEPDGGAFAHDVETRVGGVGANVAVALDRLGRDVAFVSRIGDDDRGRLVREHLADTGIDTTHVAVGDGTTSYSHVFRDPAGQRMIVTAGGSFRDLRLTDAALETIRGAEAVFLTAYTPDPVAAAVLERVAAASGNDANAADANAADANADHANAADTNAADGPAVAFDLSGPVSELLDRGTAPETIHGLVRHADLFVAADVAAGAYFGGEAAARERVGAAVDGTADRAVLTHGADGATVLAHGRRSRVDAFDVDAVDTTGAGDAFVAGLIDGWLLDDARPDAGVSSGDPVDGIEAGVRFAAAIAAINCTSPSAQAGLPTRSAVEAFLRERGW